MKKANKAKLKELVTETQASAIVNIYNMAENTGERQYLVYHCATMYHVPEAEVIQYLFDQGCDVLDVKPIPEKAPVERATICNILKGLGGIDVVMRINDQRRKIHNTGKVESARDRIYREIKLLKIKD